jgi:hypothetical protein
VVLVVPLLVLAGCAGDGAPGAVPAGPSQPVGTGAGGALTPAELAQQFGDAVWRVDTDGCDLEGGGTAFAIAPDLLVTNRHVVEFDMTPTLTSRDGATVLAAKVIGLSDVVDLAVLQVEVALDTVLVWAATDALAEGQPVVSLGYPAPLHAFSVNPGTLNAFDVVDGVRTLIVSDESSDYGSSGGPLLTDRGSVAGIVTEFAASGGAQLAGYSLTYDAVREELAAIIAAPGTVEADCAGAAYGTDEVLDTLWEWCEDGAMWACDELFLYAVTGSEYERFGAGCGDRAETEEWCTVLFGEPEAVTFGDDPRLDRLWLACAAERSGWQRACDDLSLLAPTASEYAAFGAGCGERDPRALVTCEERYP